MSKNFHGTIIMGPGRYDYRSFTIIAQPYYMINIMIKMYRTAGMFGGVNVWQIAELKVFGEMKFNE